MSNTSPKHYSNWTTQPLDFIRDNDIDFLRGNVIKYLLRHKEKNKLEDIQKAYVYLMQHVAKEYGIDGVNTVLETEWDVTNKYE